MRTHEAQTLQVAARAMQWLAGIAAAMPASVAAACVDTFDDNDDDEAERRAIEALAGAIEATACTRTDARIVALYAPSAREAHMLAIAAAIEAR